MKKIISKLKKTSQEISIISGFTSLLMFFLFPILVLLLAGAIGSIESSKEYVGSNGNFTLNDEALSLVELSIKILTISIFAPLSLSLVFYLINLKNKIKIKKKLSFTFLLNSLLIISLAIFAFQFLRTSL